MTCLQKALVSTAASEEQVVCDDVTDYAFGTHPGCYTQRGRSICFLPPSDLRAVFGRVI